MKFEKYERQSKRIVGTPTLRITEKTFVLNVACVRECFEGKGFVELHFDPENSVIGLVPTTIESKDSYSVKQYRKGSPTGVIAATDFIRHYSIMDIVKDKKTFPVEKGEKDMLIVRLQ